MLEFKDNRIAGLLNEVRDLIADIDDVDAAYRLYVSLRLYAFDARNKHHELTTRRVDFG